MAFLIGGANSLTAGYDIDNSLRCNGTDSYLTFTLGTPTSAKKATFSAWGKFNGQRSGSNDNAFWSMGDDYGQAMNIVRTNGTPQIYLDDSDGKWLNFNNRMLRDPSAWYHLFVQIDTTQSTATNRMKFFVNGIQLDNTTATAEAQPDEDYDVPGLASGQVMSISSRAGAAHFIDGYIAEMIYLDGTVGAISDFGETDEDSGIWKPKKYSGSYGNNGAFLEFKQSGTDADASGIGADTSGNTNHFAVNNLAAIDQTTDSPTNNWCTMNPLDNYFQASTFTEGNTQIATSDSVISWNTGTFGVASGKWYYEAKVTVVAAADGDNYMNIGIASSFATANDVQFSFNSYDYAYEARFGKVKSSNAAGTTHGAAWGTDIIGCAFDLDNNTIAFSKNGQWADGSGNSDESNLDDTISITAASATPTRFYYPALGDNVGDDAMTVQLNFGNPPFAISSGNADANGYGNFEYAVPSGYFSLCSKNLAEHG